MSASARLWAQTTNILVIGWSTRNDKLAREAGWWLTAKKTGEIQVVPIGGTMRSVEEMERIFLSRVDAGDPLYLEAYSLIVRANMEKERNE